MSKPLTKGQMYGRRWQRMRARHLQANPLCVMCEQMGQVKVATVVDHIVPHKGDVALLYNAGNLQSLCDSCHSAHKQSQERTGILAGAKQDGMPVDQWHPWSRQAALKSNEDMGRGRT